MAGNRKAGSRQEEARKNLESSRKAGIKLEWQGRHGAKTGVRRGYVVSASGRCTAVPGSNPARHPSLGSAQENPGAEKYRSRFFPAQQQEIPAQQQAYQPITKDEYCINTVARKLEK